MPEGFAKVPQSASPVARSGAGDISERELSRERSTLQSTPPARVQPAHPKKQLFSTPVNKFTAVSRAPSSNLERIKSCLQQYRSQTPVRRAPVCPKAVSMEDLTPTKRIRNERSDLARTLVRSPAIRSVAEEQAARLVCKFLVLSAWRRRRDEVRCLRKTLEVQVSSSERLRIQVSTLKALLDSDNAKVRLAMRELERLKQLLRDRDIEKALLEREKLALERDVCAAEDQASEMSIGWRNCRNELDGVRAAAAACDRALALERAAAAEARGQRDLAYRRLSIIEEELNQHEVLLSSAEEEVAALRREADDKQTQLNATREKLRLEQEARSLCARECVSLGASAAGAAAEAQALREAEARLRGELGALQRELAATREQLDWWPRPLTKMLGAARGWLRRPLSLPEALLWAVIPARHGC